MAVAIEVLEMAKMAGFENWLNEESAGRGWYACEITGKKFRGQQALDMLFEQAQFMAEQNHQRAEEDMKDEDSEINSGITIDLPAPKTPIPARKGAVKVFHEHMPGSQDTMGVLHENGMIERITDKLATHLEIKIIEGKPVKMTTINCGDCGTPRDIKVQDAFQVTRCPSCQKKYRNRKRAERRRQKTQEAKASE